MSIVKLDDAQSDVPVRNTTVTGLVACSVCTAEVSRRATVCPKCGQPHPWMRPGHWLLTGVLTLLFVLFVWWQMEDMFEGLRQFGESMRSV